MKETNVYEWFTCAGDTIAGVSRITGAIEAVVSIGTSSVFTASSVVHSAFIHICALLSFS